VCRRDLVVRFGWSTNIERMRTLLSGEDMSKNNYVIPTAVLERLLEAAAAHYRVRVFFHVHVSAKVPNQTVF